MILFYITINLGVIAINTVWKLDSKWAEIAAEMNKNRRTG